MVVGITLATIAYFKTRGSSASFMDPDALHRALKKEVKDEERRRSALDLADGLTRITDEHDSFLRASLNRYAELVQDFDTDAAQILDDAVNPAMEKRHAALLSFIDLRSQLRELLTQEEWTAVFGEPDQG
jgi:hypothetical protein